MQEKQNYNYNHKSFFNSEAVLYIFLSYYIIKSFFNLTAPKVHGIVYRSLAPILEPCNNIQDLIGVIVCSAKERSYEIDNFIFFINLFMKNDGFFISKFMLIINLIVLIFLFFIPIRYVVSLNNRRVKTLSVLSFLYLSLMSYLSVKELHGISTITFLHKIDYDVWIFLFFVYPWLTAFYFLFIRPLIGFILIYLKNLQLRSPVNPELEDSLSLPKKSKIKKVKRLVKIFGAGFVFLLVAGILWLGGQWWLSKHDEVEHIAIYVKSEQERVAGSDAIAFAETMTKKLTNLDSTSKKGVYWKFLYQDDSSQKAIYINWYQEIQRKIYTDHTLQINYIDTEEEDQISFHDDQNHHPWYRTYSPILEPALLSNDLPISGSLGTLSTQTMAMIYLQTAKMYYERDMLRESWLTLKKAWETQTVNQTEDSPDTPLSEIDYLKQEPAYFYLLALLTPWAENNPSEDVLPEQLEKARDQLTKGQYFLSQKQDSNNAELDASYRLYLLQTYYTLLSDIEGIQKASKLFSSKEAPCDPDREVWTQNRSRIVTFTHLKIKLILDFPDLLDQLGESPGDLVTQLKSCDSDSIESDLLASQIHLELPQGNLESSWHFWRKAFRRDIDARDSSLQLYRLCLRQPDKCPSGDESNEVTNSDELNKVTNWIDLSEIDLRGDKRVFRFGDEWGSRAAINQTIALGISRLDARYKSNSVMQINILSPTKLQEEERYRIQSKIICGSNETFPSLKVYVQSSPQDRRSYDILFGQTILANYKDTLVYISKAQRTFRARCNASIVLSDIYEEQLPVKRNIWVLGRPKLVITENSENSESNTMRKFKISVEVSFKTPLSNKHVFQFKMPESTDHDDPLTVRLSLNSKEETSFAKCSEEETWKKGKNSVTISLPKECINDSIKGEIYYGGDEPILEGFFNTAG